MMQIEQQLMHGITEAKWIYSGAPCYSARKPSEADTRRDIYHRAANGKRYTLAMGLLINGHLTHPGAEVGCKCTFISIIPGFKD
jgi:hypothetical protein